MSFLFYLGNKLLIESALIEAAEEIKIEGTTAHLWFEEIMSGDSTESIDGVWKDIDDADWYAKAMLDGGENAEGTYFPLQDPQLRASIVAVRKALAEFKKIAVNRYNNFSDAVPGSEIDSQFDAVFLDFIKQAENVERMIKIRIHREYNQYRYLSIFLIFVSTILSFVLSSFLFKREKNRTKLFESLREAKQAIEEKNFKLDYMAHYDALTGLPNRVLFLDRLEQTIVHAMRKQFSVALLFIDLDHFKAVNDQYGHQQGDQLLKQVSQRLRNCIREEDSAVRISGDEFIIILGDMADINSAIKVSNSIAAEVMKKLQEPYDLDGSIIHISASTGVALYPDDGSNAEILIKHADAAMYHAKSLGKNNIQFFSSELNRQAQRQLEIEHNLRTAIEEDQFILHYHPQWQLNSGKISGLEVLVRWQHPEQGMIFPDEFIPVAESCGLIQQLDLLIVSKAFHQLKSWNMTGFDFGCMAINISPICFCRADFFNNIQNLISDIGVDAGSIELEITESVLVNNVKQSQQLLLDLHRLGLRIAIDDFGTGYSSMSYLKDFVIDTLKIDRSFVSEYNQSKTSSVVLKNMINLGIDLGLDVVAEGIETIEQETYLKDLNCSIGQGFLLTKPLPAQELENFLTAKLADNIINIASKQV
ncbi:MAG: EAL domain-containing protein [gamma proteobacterium symbiont of Taylorina sp.]|nr:EAL domain-containing protein [gamma proteobacterium symbiont of Taylorina sp.]